MSQRRKSKYGRSISAGTDVFNRTHCYFMKTINIEQTKQFSIGQFIDTIVFTDNLFDVLLRYSAIL